MNSLTKIKERFSEVINYSQGIDVDSVAIGELFDKWSRNKKRFVDKWGGLTYELDQTLTFKKCDTERKRARDLFIVDFTYFSTDMFVQEFLMAQSVNAFYSNRTDVDWVHPKKDKIKIQAGSKISKSLKNFMDTSNPTLLNKFQNRLSMLIQEEKIQGKLVMSVHPLDFLSSSENSHNWHSCHALDGEYRVGSLSYMCDEVTFITYLKTENDVDIPRFPFEWNSKKWRMLAHLNKEENILVRGREYPFASQHIADYIKDNMIERFYPQFVGGFEHIQGEIEDVMEDAFGSLHFNDCLCSSTYLPQALLSDGIEREDIPFMGLEPMQIGSEVLCLSCGKHLIEYSGIMQCNCCGNVRFCDHCGEVFSNDEEVFESVHGETLCEMCYHSNVLFCECCGAEFELDSPLIAQQDDGDYICTLCAKI